jgi:hypothetical protein
MYMQDTVLDLISGFEDPPCLLVLLTWLSIMFLDWQLCTTLFVFVSFH